MIIFRLLALFLLWKYIKDEYSAINDGERTMATSTA